MAAFPEPSPAAAHAARERYRVVDVREPHEFHGPLGRVEGAELVPLATLADRARDLAGPRPLLLVCRSGRRSAAACQALQQRGVRDVANLGGGMIAWNRAGLPVVHTPPASLEALVDQIVAWVAQVGPLARDEAGALAHRVLEAEGPPSRAGLEALIRAAGEAAGDPPPPDLDLSLAWFRRSLAAL